MADIRKLFALLAAPWALFGFGLSLNVLAISVNHGTMPVAIPTGMQDAIDAATAAGLIHNGMIDGIHKVMVAGDHLKFLCDWIQLPGIGTASIGDLFLWLGDALKVPAALVVLVKMWERPCQQR
jgi:hypothetical protein